MASKYFWQDYNYIIVSGKERENIPKSTELT